MSLQLHAIVKYNANYAAGTARYCVKLQQKSHNTTLDLCLKARARTYVAAISESAVIEINVFDYNVHARSVRLNADFKLHSSTV